MKRLIFVLTAATIALMGCNVTDPDDSPAVETPSGALDQAPAGNSGLPGKATVLRLLGTATAYESTVADIDGDNVDDAALCFDVDLLDASGRVIGTATDCLSNIESVGGGLALVGTTTFNLPNGSFTTRGSTTVQPITTTAPTPVTHTTGAIPIDGDDGVIAGTGAYAHFSAQARLSGAVNLSKLDSDGQISFDCLFAIAPLN